MREAEAASPRIDMASMPVQRPDAPASPAQDRARFFNSGNAFNIKLPAIPAAIFLDESVRAVDAKTTSLIACDQSAAIGTSFAATTPLMLARYATIAADDAMVVNLVATGIIWYVIGGSGTAVIGSDSFDWATGDVFVTPGGVDTTLSAGPNGAVLWLVSNEPQLSFDGLHPSTGPEAAIETVHYPAAEIAAQLQRVVDASANETTSGMALIFSSARHEASRNIMPSLTLSLNTVPAGEQQRPHRHNSAAITLILRGDNAYSKVGGTRCDWSPFATLVTPPGDPHSHHNDGDERALFLIVQDGGLHSHARTMGFTFLEANGPKTDDGA
ncbi:gentisate 1,2-dioxygenase [Rhizobium sp. SG_E_25_P2]|uniref:cupin domain-containing protein n=1 Tax=Rhizobium sp. SG_E_25_P2 TaxID=2879942 RepID=UPI002474A89D|nr:cupin domain-containing protein [Rhizobium sp. SG_E_25_P2]MDH6268159.1 gentisate 1,2-dioxygenase [Rhizobium sp. SG_E_25_P2]